MNKPLSSHFMTLLCLSLSLALSGVVCAQGTGGGRAQSGPPQSAPLVRVERDPAIKFLLPYGVANFSDHYVSALSALLRAQDRYDAGVYADAKRILDALWADYPAGGPEWGALPTQPFGINIGSPPSYYALRMLTDTTNWRVNNAGHGPALRTARLTVVLVGRSIGIQPQDIQDIQQGTGVQVHRTLDPRILSNEYRVIDESLALFREYVLAATQGQLGLETQVLHLPNVVLPVHAEELAGRYYAGLTDASRVWPSISPEVIEDTDWWWILYPSHVPEQYPDFEHAEFVTGGMGVGPDSRSPYFIIDDRWLVRKPPHIGDGHYTQVERSAYLPQWLQHEFFHHLFRTYPEFGLEDSPHQWFDLGTWPADFEGRYEADYFHEALYRRLQNAARPLVSALRYSTAGAPWELFGVGDLLGTYQRTPVQNNWHTGTIQFGPALEWQNLANVDWGLQDDISNGHLLTGPDNPYYSTWNGRKFDIVLRRDALGDFLPELVGFSFNGDIYGRLGR